MVSFYSYFLTCNDTASVHDVVRKYLETVARSVGATVTSEGGSGLEAVTGTVLG